MSDRLDDRGWAIGFATAARALRIEPCGLDPSGFDRLSQNNLRRVSFSTCQSGYSTI
jgi:hypothetical protein